MWARRLSPCAPASLRPNPRQRRGRRLDQAAHIFAALGDKPVCGWCPGYRPAVRRPSRTSPRHSVTRQAITKHLNVLAGAGVATSARVGRESLWEVAPEPLEAARRCLKGISAQ
jgi:hypothetical protein